MNEFEWLYGGDPIEMLESLRPPASKRKLRLFMSAYLRNRGRDKEANTIERFADGIATEEDYITAPGWATTVEVLRRVMEACLWRRDTDLRGDDAHEERQRSCALLRELFGNPYHPRRLDGRWLRWNDGAVTRMAQAIYDEARFADLPVLADALEEAACDDALLLHHCRAGSEHVRGCWAVDLLLGKT